MNDKNTYRGLQIAWKPTADIHTQDICPVCKGEDPLCSTCYGTGHVCNICHQTGFVNGKLCDCGSAFSRSEFWERSHLPFPPIVNFNAIEKICEDKPNLYQNPALDAWIKEVYAPARGMNKNVVHRIFLLDMLPSDFLMWRQCSLMSHRNDKSYAFLYLTPMIWVSASDTDYMVNELQKFRDTIKVIDPWQRFYRPVVVLWELYMEDILPNVSNKKRNVLRTAMSKIPFTWLLLTPGFASKSFEYIQNAKILHIPKPDEEYF